MTERREVYLPAQLALEGRVLGSPVRQLRRPEVVCRAEIHSYPRGRDRRLVVQEDGTRTLVVPRKLKLPADVDEVLMVPEGDTPLNGVSLRELERKVRWLQPTPSGVEGVTPTEWEDLCSRTRASWRNRFFFREELRENGAVTELGLRPPQIGALHAALAHWTVTDERATVVMPTGTGKTETMLTLFVYRRLDRLLVVVPTSALREQTAAKFESLGVLIESGVVAPDVAYPVVGTLEHRLRTPDEVDEYFRCCNVVVTTMAVIGGCGDDVQRRMAEMSSHLFIDEAHHISAPTWEKFRRFFAGKDVLQFTATPFRGDGRHVDGKIIFDYPLRKAQAEGYFRPIDFLPVNEYRSDRSDDEIARSAVERLERDLERGLNHVVMARTDSVKRAEEVHGVYRRLAAAYDPLLIHNEKSATQKREALRKLREGAARIIVCVNMLGEGFDMPELKIAALHEAHKSLAVTLQFVGRFTRTREDIGDAAVVANVAAPGMAESLQKLYAEDADWNLLLRGLSEGATGREVQRSEFLRGFDDTLTEIPLQNVFPKMSTVVYRTGRVDWEPEGVREVVQEARLYSGPTLNRGRNVVLFVTREREPVPWGDIRDVYNTVWDLYLLYWDAEQRLLFINSSNNGSLHEDLAEAVAGEGVRRIRGEEVFRVLHGVNRPLLMNLGLNHSLSRAVRFTMYAGPDIEDGLAQAHYENRIKSNLFARGFENGEKTSVGCSYKGRIWSHRIAWGGIPEWMEWCRAIGAKLLDETISVREILRYVLIPVPVTERPRLVPLAIEWPDEFLQRSEEAIEVDVDGDMVPFYEAGLELVDHASYGPLRFRVFTETKSVDYEMVFSDDGAEYVPIGEGTVEFVVGRRREGLPERFREEHPMIWFENGACLMHEMLRPPSVRRDDSPFDKDRIEAWNWSGIDLRKESQNIERRRDSIQYRLIQELLGDDIGYDIVFDDDDRHEAADVVAVKVDGEDLIVHLFHCKFSSGSSPGHRVGDLYTVCGQAQRSVHWRDDPGKLMGPFATARGGPAAKARGYAL